MERIKALIANLQAWWNRLTSRERKMVAGAGTAAVLFLVFIILVSSAASAAGYHRRIALKLRELGEAQELAASYRQGEQARQAMERQLSASNLRLISYLEERATAAGLEIPTLNPKADMPVGDGSIVESAADVTFSEIPLNKLIDFLNGIEQGPGVIKVKSLRFEPRPANDSITAWVTVATYHLK